MKATINSEKKHFPVLLKEIKSIISPLYGGTFIDCTFGQGGYSKEILKDKKNTVIAFDRDRDVIKYAEVLKKKFGNRFFFKNIKFQDIHKENFKILDLKAIIFDLGLSSLQINDHKKGISFKSNSKLNMQVGLNTISANDVINKMTYEDIYKIIKYFGEEKKSKLIAKLIVENRLNNQLDTQGLVSLIEIAKREKIRNKTHPATKTFQAIRMFVNKEISQLIYGLINSFQILPIGGVLVVVTFHSIEDKIVKFFFKNYSENKNTSRYLPDNNNKKKLIFKLDKKKPIYPSKEETKINPSSRSAKLRYAIKINNNKDFKSFVDKFKFYLNLEDLDKNL